MSQLLPTLPSSAWLTGRTARITGSSPGIGLALACGLAQAGAAVVLNGRDATKLAAAAATAAENGVRLWGLGWRWNAERDQAADFSAAKKEPSVIRC